MWKLFFLFSVLLAASSNSLVGAMFGSKENQNCKAPCVPGDESIMDPKEHGTSPVPVQDNLRWGCDNKLADRICNYNRHYAEHSGYFLSTSFLSDVMNADLPPTPKNPVTFYDSNTGKPLFKAPIDRTWEDFIAESRRHGWPSFRDAEVDWDYVRVLKNGETVSLNGTHLGHNLPDKSGNRYCINLVSVAGNPDEASNRKK